MTLPPAPWEEGFFQGCNMAVAGFGVIFWEPECCGVYSVYSTIWMVQGSNCSRDKNFSLPENNQTIPGVPGFFTWIKQCRV